LTHVQLGFRPRSWLHYRPDACHRRSRPDNARAIGNLRVTGEPHGARDNGGLVGDVGAAALPGRDSHRSGLGQKAGPKGSKSGFDEALVVEREVQLTRIKAIDARTCINPKTESADESNWGATMKVLVGYASSEGHTRKIARRVSDHIADGGHAVELVGLADAGDIDLRRFDRVILAASIHIGHYQQALSEFTAEQAQGLHEKPTLFLSVSLAAAGHDAEDWRGLDRILEDFESATGWKPDRVEQIAGAYRPKEYDVFRRFVMRRIVAAKDPEADLDNGKEYTDWQALDALIDDWLAA
jgi:menaquinone-dependent protoporphyrinogen oxidase